MLGLIGFTDSEVRHALKRQGIDYDELQAALAERTATNDRIAAALNPVK
ncbi:hypothetical protein ACFPOB_29650 [Bosea eneae]|uniref:DUF3606 domain-containing protein n=1 Tax=Bosea eneae TaxID=151454 RepID=A0ABW0J060_9HYPH